MIFNKYKIHDDREINCQIVPIGDLHFNSVAFDHELFESFVKFVNKLSNPKFIVLGDVTDDDRPSTKDRRKQMYLDRNEAYVNEDIQHMNSLKKTVIRKLSFLNKNNCLGILDGDHYRIYNNGKTSTQFICESLSVPYLGDGQAFLAILFQIRESSKKYLIHCQHGIGYNAKSGGVLNRIEEFAAKWEGIDMFLRGHSHGAVAKGHPKNRINDYGHIEDNIIWHVNAGSFRKTYNEGKKSYIDVDDDIKEFLGLKKNITDYAEKRMYGPVNRNLIYFNMNVKRSPDKNRRVELKVEKIETPML